MPLDDETRIRHLLDAVGSAGRFIDGRRRADLDTDDMLTLAPTKLVEIVGEAAKQISTDKRAEYPSIPWPEAARMRDRLVHHYFDIDRRRLVCCHTRDADPEVRSAWTGHCPRDRSMS